MKRSHRLILSAFTLSLVSGLSTTAATLQAEREAALERARIEQSLILTERTAIMLGELFQVPEILEEYADEREGQ